VGRMRPALDAGFFIFRRLPDGSRCLGDSEVPPGAGPMLFDNRMRQLADANVCEDDGLCQTTIPF
jgi:hypothetical protein